MKIYDQLHKNKNLKKVALCLPSAKAVRFLLFVIFCVAMIFSCWGEFPAWSFLAHTKSDADDDGMMMMMINDCELVVDAGGEKDDALILFYLHYLCLVLEQMHPTG